MEDLEICKGQRGIYGGNSVLWVLWNNRKMSGSIVRMAQTGESNPKKEQRKKKNLIFVPLLGVFFPLLTSLEAGRCRE